jgi:hypothetical protein
VHNLLLVCLSVSACLGRLSTQHTRQSSIQNNKHQVSHEHGCFSWWWAHSRPKHVEKRNKHTKKNCAPSWLYLHGYTGIHGKQSIKNKVVLDDTFSIYKACPSESGTEVGAPLFPAVELCDFSGRWQCMSWEIWYTLDSGSVLLTETEAR